MKKEDGVVEVKIDIGENNEQVVLGFDQEVSWVEMSPLVAIKVAEGLKEKAIEILRSIPK